MKQQNKCKGVTLPIIRRWYICLVEIGFRLPLTIRPIDLLLSLLSNIFTIFFQKYFFDTVCLQSFLSHPALRNKARCISYMRQEDNIYNNRVYRDKCHNNQSIYYIAEDLLQNKRINIKRTKDRRRQCQLRNAT
jgi:hypothetical protein